MKWYEVLLGALVALIINDLLVAGMLYLAYYIFMNTPLDHWVALSLDYQWFWGIAFALVVGVAVWAAIGLSQIAATLRQMSGKQ